MQLGQFGVCLAAPDEDPCSVPDLMLVSLCFRDLAVLILSPSLADRQVISSSERLLTGQWEAEPTEEAGPVTWSEGEGEELNRGIRLKIQHPKVREHTCLIIDT